MEELIIALQNMIETAALPEKYLAEVRSELPQSEKECRIYALLAVTPLMNEVSISELDVVLVYNYLELRYENRQFRDMHMFFCLCYLAMDMELPPLFEEFAQFDELLEILMREMLRGVGRYVVDVCGMELEGVADE